MITRKCSFFTQSPNQFLSNFVISANLIDENDQYFSFIISLYNISYD